jgi:predicted nucleotidyltransferase
MSTVQRLADRGRIKPPNWLPGNVQYETIMGSVAYGVSSDTSDVDGRTIMDADARLKDEVARHPYPLIFATISGAHLYGFPSPDSDYDLRGCHVLPVREAVGLDPGRETIESSTTRDRLEVDLVTHDARKFFGLMLKKNGYVLEQLYSPLVVHSTPDHNELKALGRGCITKHHSHHYFGFAETQWRLFEKETPRRVKPLLYVYRVLLTGIHLMKTGDVEANLARLNEEARLTHVDDLIARKRGATELCTLHDSAFELHSREYERLRAELETAYQSSTLPEGPSARPALNDLLVRLRLATFGRE